MHRRQSTVAALCLCLPIAAACGVSDADAPDPVAQATFAPELDIDLNAAMRTESGLYIQELAAGDGEAIEAGDMIRVHYTGWLPDGTKFDSSVDRDEPFPVRIGVGDVIPGWDEGVVGMQVGGRRRLIIPPALAYGESGAGDVIPPNAVLVFEVEALAVGDGPAEQAES